VQIITPAANQHLDANSGYVVDVPLDAFATGAGSLIFSWSDTLGLIGGYKSNEIAFAHLPANFPCNAQPDTLKVTVKDSHGQSASASELIYLKAC
jgi:hypothetical protein